MAIFTSGAGIANDPLNEGPSFIYEIVDFLRTNSSWTVAGSGDGVGPGQGMGTDAIVNQAALETSTSWVVLEDPDATVQLLFARVGGGDLQWNVTINPDADYSAGDYQTTPTNAGGNALQVCSTNLIDSGSSRIHILCENGVTTANAGWAVYMHANGDFSNADGSLAVIPLTNGPAGDTHPFLFLVGIGASQAFTIASGLISSSTAVNDSGCRGVVPGASNVSTYPALQYSWGGGILSPNNAGVDTVGKDLLFPIAFGRYTGLADPGFKGSGDFMRFNGVTRTSCSTLEGLTRVTFGDVNFPWDGVSTPTNS